MYACSKGWCRPGAHSQCWSWMPRVSFQHAGGFEVEVVYKWYIHLLCNCSIIYLRKPAGNTPTPCQKSLLSLKDNCQSFNFFLHYFSVTWCNLPFFIFIYFSFFKSLSILFGQGLFQAFVILAAWTKPHPAQLTSHTRHRKVAYGWIILNIATDWHGGWQLPLMYGHPTTSVTEADTLSSKLFFFLYKGQDWLPAFRFSLFTCQCVCGCMYVYVCFF